MKKSVVHAAVLAAIGGSVASVPQVAWAQPRSATLEEVVVTATRRDASLQDTPLAVTAISAQDLEVRNIENVQDLTANVPNVLFYGTGRGITNSTLTMRGIPNVGVYVDGVWQVSDAGLLQRQFVDLNRVEVLRGPHADRPGLGRRLGHDLSRRRTSSARRSSSVPGRSIAATSARRSTYRSRIRSRHAGRWPPTTRTATWRVSRRASITACSRIRRCAAICSGRRRTR